VSAHLIVPTNDEVESDTIHLIPQEGTLLSAETGPVETKPVDHWTGMLGLIGVGAILGLSLYSIMKYLF